MGNRTTEKSNIQALNIPSVTNAEMNTMLQNYLADNLVFREDVAVAQNSSVSSITVDFTGKDRVNLTRTGGALNITVSGLVDGDRKFLLITKTSGQVISWVGVTDVTPLVDNIDALSLVLYEIVRKGSNYYARAYALTVEVASQSEAEAGTSDDVVMTPLAQTYRDGGLLTKVVEIGDWDMDASSSANVAHGLTLSDIRAVEVVVRSDTDTLYYPLNYAGPAGTVSGWVVLGATNVVLTRLAGGSFDNTGFDSTSYNRGWVVIRYED